MNRREIIKYGIGAVVGVTATKVLGSSVETEPEILDYVEDRTPLIYSPGQFIWFKGWIYISPHYNTPRTDTTTTITLYMGNTPDYLPKAEFIGAIKKVNFEGKEKLAIDWVKHKHSISTVLAWNKKTHAHILQKLYINNLSPFSYNRYNFDQSVHNYSYYANDPYFVIREESDCFVPAREYFKGLER